VTPKPPRTGEGDQPQAGGGRTRAAATTGYRPEFIAALQLFAHVSKAMHERGLSRPILVGGAAAEFYSQSAISTGDFDLCTFQQQALEEEMLKHGFVRPSGPGQMTKGLVHPDLKLGFEVVASTPMDGNFDRDTLVLVGNIGDGAFVVISVEDLIADRMGQFASGTAADRLGQAQVLFDLGLELDRAYLDRRIREETGGDHGIETLERD